KAQPPPVVFSTAPAPSPATPLSLPAALPIWNVGPRRRLDRRAPRPDARGARRPESAEPRVDIAGGVAASPVDPTARRDTARNIEDRKSTRLNSSHDQISYAVFFMRKKKRPTL